MPGDGRGFMKQMASLTERELGLYVHIPFCVRKCDYCDFLSMPVEEALYRRYVNQLKQEIKKKAERCGGYQVPTVFFGRGTPSVLPGGQIEEIMDSLQQNFDIRQDAEITVECNPGTLTQIKLASYKRAGVNRLSLGLQSAKNEELKRLGRIHCFEEFLASLDLARKAGFDNVNVDLMSALPGQTLQDWRYTLKKVLAVKPEHISAYSLIIEEGTPFYDKYREDELRRQKGETPQYLPDEETERQMYAMTTELLAEKGYYRYEISNYALPGKACRHNMGYWRLTPYLGLGLGSSSLLESARFCNASNLEQYLWGDPCSLKESPELLQKSRQMEEFMFLGLRMTEGISRNRFQELFGIELECIYKDALDKLRRQGLLQQREGRVFLTEEGISVSNYALSEFLLE